MFISAQNITQKCQVEESSSASRTVQITCHRNQKVASANFDESGEYDDSMREWTVHFLKSNHASSCPLEWLPHLEIKIGGPTGYNCSFATTDREGINIRVYNVRTQDEKSFSLTIGNEVLLLGRISGWPEGRSPDYSDEDEEFNGTLDSLIPVLQSGSLSGVKISLGCAVFKLSLLRNEQQQNIPKIVEEMGMNWETFEGGEM